MGRISAEIGREYEELVAAYLVNCGYCVLERNFRGGTGELDIVAEMGGKVYFVEVKARKAGSRVSPWEAVTQDKQRRLMSAARAWLQKRQRGGDCPCSFLLAVVENGDRSDLKISLVEDFLCW